MNIQLLSSKMILFSISFFLLICITTPAQTTVTPVVTYTNSGVADQDDMCVWIHPTDKSLSAIIASDKGSNRIFVYGLNGSLIQNLSVPGMPGNIDVRYNFSLNGQLIDIVGYNDRSSSTLRFYKIDKSTRLLSYIGGFASGSNYGFCLYKSPSSGKYYAFSSNSSSAIRQYLLSGTGTVVTGNLERTLANGSGNTEGMVCDDETGILYAGNEGAGIYKFNAEPGVDTRTLVAATGVDGFSADVEGLSIYYLSNGNGYLIASSQGNDRFYVFNRKSPHSYVKYFTASGIGATDGVDVCNVNLGGNFSQGIFLCHDGTGSPYSVKAVKFQDLGLTIDTDYWDPRGENLPSGLNDDDNKKLPEDYLLLQNYPNPFNPSTEISFYLPEITKLRLCVYNVIGELTSILIDGEITAGIHQIEFDAKGLTSGVYFYRIETDKFIETKKMIILR